uniref:Glutaryl-CoA dehydrogenase n=1 Tax=Fusarium oxysporum (strain Fo5176) TaxID=660025 RepID=A0A0D2Y1S6_FUSOF
MQIGIACEFGAVDSRLLEHTAKSAYYLEYSASNSPRSFELCTDLQEKRLTEVSIMTGTFSGKWESWAFLEPQYRPMDARVLAVWPQVSSQKKSNASTQATGPPNHGSDPGSMETIARPHPTRKGYYSISGAKTWITNSPIADLLLVWAKLETTGKIRGFLIERDQCPPGTLETPAIKEKNGLRASITGMIQLDSCPVPEENMLQVEGLKGPFSCLNSARYGIAFGTMGALEDCIDRARTYALDRKQFGNPLAKYQLVQKKLSDALTDAAYGTLAAIQVGRLKDEGTLAPEMISIIKRQNCDRALAGARTSAIYDIPSPHLLVLTLEGRHVANLFVVQTYEGQSDIHWLQAFY